MDILLLSLGIKVFEFSLSVVYSKDWLLGPNGPSATILGY